jgi:CheY-like chemotaxis protein
LYEVSFFYRFTEVISHSGHIDPLRVPVLALTVGVTIGTRYGSSDKCAYICIISSLQQMSNSGPIIIIDDDEDDQFLIKQCISELSVENVCRCFSNGQTAYDYLLKTEEQPFLILCDMNMPVLNGLELRNRIDADPYLKNKSIPFVFLSTSDDEALVKKAYKGTIQGYYKKQPRYNEFKESIKQIIGYWRLCLHPNNLHSNLSKGR